MTERLACCFVEVTIDACQHHNPAYAWGLHAQIRCKSETTLTCAGGVFEEALAQAAYFLEPGSPIARTVRNAEIIDNVWESGSLSPQARPCPSTMLQLRIILLTALLCQHSYRVHQVAKVRDNPMGCAAPSYKIYTSEL